MDSLFCGKATPVAAVHRTAAKSRLSSPFWYSLSAFAPRVGRLLFFRLRKLVGQNGLEPSTSRLSVVCSSQLSYWPIDYLVIPSQCAHWRGNPPVFFRASERKGCSIWPLWRSGGLPHQSEDWFAMTRSFSVFCSFLIVNCQFSIVNSFPMPSKLNNAKSETLCTDLRTLQKKSSSLLKSP